MASTFKFVPYYGTDKQISSKDKSTGNFLMAEEGKIYFDVDEQNRVLVGQKDSTFVFKQVSPSSVWTINHKLGKYPGVMIIDSAGTEIKGDIDYVDENNITITFTSGFSGRAILN